MEIIVLTAKSPHTYHAGLLIEMTLQAPRRVIILSITAKKVQTTIRKVFLSVLVKMTRLVQLSRMKEIRRRNCLE